MNRDGLVVENFLWKLFRGKTENLFLRLTREKRKEKLVLIYLLFCQIPGYIFLSLSLFFFSFATFISRRTQAHKQVGDCEKFLISIFFGILKFLFLSLLVCCNCISAKRKFIDQMPEITWEPITDECILIRDAWFVTEYENGTLVKILELMLIFFLKTLFWIKQKLMYFQMYLLSNLFIYDDQWRFEIFQQFLTWFMLQKSWKFQNFERTPENWINLYLFESQKQNKKLILRSSARKILKWFQEGD